MVRTLWHKLFSQGQSGVRRGDRWARVWQRRMQKPLLESLEDRCLLSYQITDLGALDGRSSHAYGLNDAGQVAGISTTENAILHDHAFFWDSGALTDLGTLGRDPSLATGINLAGQAVGYSYTVSLQESPRAFLWEAGTMTDLGTLGGHRSAADGINNAGQVVGWSDIPPGSSSFHAFLWQDGVMNDLGALPGQASKADAINDAGHVVGYSTIGNVQHAVFWQDGVITDLGTLPDDYNSEATAINNLGHIVGWSADFDLTQFRAVFHDGGVGPPDSIATGINDSDQVVGYTHFLGGGTDQRAFIYADGVLTDLNTLIPPDSGFILTRAEAINNNGQIVGLGLNTVDDHFRAFLLTPDFLPVRTPVGSTHFTRSDAQAVLLAGYPVTTANAGAHTFSLTLATLGDQTLPVTDTAEATRIGRATVPGTSDAAAPAGRTVQNATDAVFARSHRANASVSASDWEITELELGVSLLPKL